ncbi:MAG: hypothetical protein A2V93_03040 [Ignavibacteria bacterium RBG_16_34_14]|nr:MAG: hypothetical protein A2V93_03040 [Ignavibacteria bacterium RBG_16_34_14]
MGQQQLLLIVLGVIVVGIAVVVGINLFNANAVSSNRDGVVSDLNNLGAMAQQHYKKPGSMGGGSNTFNTGGPIGNGWEIPSQLDTTANGNYSAALTAQSVTITGTGTEKNDAGQNIQHQAVVSPTSITVTQVR